MRRASWFIIIGTYSNFRKEMLIHVIGNLYTDTYNYVQCLECSFLNIVHYTLHTVYDAFPALKYSHNSCAHIVLIALNFWMPSIFKNPPLKAMEIWRFEAESIQIDAATLKVFYIVMWHAIHNVQCISWEFSFFFKKNLFITL